MPQGHKVEEVLDVWLDRFDTGPVYIGSLTRQQGGAVVLDIHDGYLSLGAARPIASLAWHVPGDEEKTLGRLMSPDDKRGTLGHLPPAFSNLLPEGALRELVETQLGTGRHTDFDVMRHLGSNLPGALRILPEGANPNDPSLPDAERYRDFPIEATSRISFSLPGMQMKFSAQMDRERLSLPGARDDEAGNNVAVILKPAAQRLPGLPENEFTCMKLAEAVGVRIAPVALLSRDLVTSVSSRHLEHGENVLVVDRFDRCREGRVHMEEFAQIMGAVGNQKYTMANGETILRMVTRFEEGKIHLFEAIRRTVANLLLGNGDAHLKNWAFVFPRPDQAALSPAYDIVSTVVYDPSDKMAQKFGGTTDPSVLGLTKFRQAAKWIGLTEPVMERVVRETVERAFDEWPAMLEDLPMFPDHKTSLIDHLERLRLSKEMELTWAGLSAPEPR